MDPIEELARKMCWAKGLYADEIVNGHPKWADFIKRARRRYEIASPLAIRMGRL